MCGGPISGLEAAVHATSSAFESDECEAALLMDATNVFNASIARLHYTTSDISAHPLPPYTSTCTEVPLSILLMEISFCIKKVQHK